MNILKPKEIYPLHLHLTDSRTEYYTFIVIGCGGTGGYLVRDLARQIAIANDQTFKTNKHRLLLIDGDVVEEKNIARQNFIRQDIGKNKAQVLAERYSAAYGLTINYIDSYIKDAKHYEEILDDQMFHTVTIGCVDNNKTRAMIAEALYNRGSRGNSEVSWKDLGRNRSTVDIWIDSGNEEYSGQVVMGSISPYPALTEDNLGRLKRCVYYNSDNEPIGYVFKTPLVTQIYPEILEAEDKHPDEESCAERAVSAPQNIATNIMAASIIFSFCNHLLLNRNGLRAREVRFNTDMINFHTVFNTVEDYNGADTRPVYED